MPEYTVTFTQEEFEITVNSVHEAAMRMYGRAHDFADVDEPTPFQREQAASYRVVGDVRKAQFERLMRHAPISHKLVDGRPIHVCGIYQVPALNTRENWSAWALVYSHSLNLDTENA